MNNPENYRPSLNEEESCQHCTYQDNEECFLTARNLEDGSGIDLDHTCDHFEE